MPDINLRFNDVATLWYGVKIMRGNFIILISILLPVLVGWRDQIHAAVPVPATEMTAETPGRVHVPGCRGCHGDVELDNSHDMACTACHLGNNEATEKKNAHTGLLAAPAAPANMAASCGSCHPEQISGCSQSLHYTIKKAINRTRSHFGIEPPLKGLTQLPDNRRPQSRTELVDDMLRRRCLRCHVYTAGDRYPYVKRGIGCAACHLQYIDGKLTAHTFVSPTERQCLSCHYANHVGSDFIGSYEHDFNWEYRTPYTTREPFIRPYGVELHQLASDIHRQRGLTCLDCHSGKEMSDRQRAVRCKDCHLPDPASHPLPDNLRRQGNQLILRGTDGKDHPIPRLTHPAHAEYKDRVSCQVCHAQWAFNDRSTHLLLSYGEDVDAWDRLTVQSSSEVETFLEHNLYSDEDELEPTMLDSITGRSKPGIWFLGFTQRRWEDILIGRDDQGMIRVFRPILDLRISAVDGDGEPLFDNVRGTGNGLLPYTPHTTGPAGLFYEKRFLHLLQADQNKTETGPEKDLPLQ